MAEIARITLPDGSVYELADETMRNATICGVSRVGNNYSLNAADVEALPITGGAVEGNITVQGKVAISEEPTADNDVATKGYVDGRKIPSVVELLVGDWDDNNEQTISVDGVKVDNNIIVAPIPNNFNKYCEFGVYCLSQDMGRLTFRCESKPNANIGVNILILN